MLAQNHDPAFQRAIKEAEDFGFERGKASMKNILEAAEAARVWMENNQPKAGDAWGCSVLRRLREALDAQS